MNYRTLRIGLLGAGTVGSNVARMLLDHADELGERIGARLELVGIAVRSLDAPRQVELPKELFTTDPHELILRSDIVIELIGGLDPAREYILEALRSGADVVTGNKALIATHGAELFEVAEQVGAQIHYEAAVGGAIPIIRPLKDSLAGDHVERIFGVVNGTTNYILDRMDHDGDSLEAALEDATERGYAERSDPSSDVAGYDAAFKAAILASVAFHSSVSIDDVYREGITGVSADEIAAAKRAGYVVKLLAICEKLTDPDSGEVGISARVYPAMVSREHPLASVHGANNAVFVEAENAGSLMFYGAGAGGPETAAAVLGDTVSAARRHVLGGPGAVESTSAKLPVLPIDAITTRCSITLRVADRAGVLAAVASVFNDHGVSVATLTQTQGSTEDGPDARLVVGTHPARQNALDRTVAALREHPMVTDVTSVLRIVDDANNE